MELLFAHEDSLQDPPVRVRVLRQTIHAEEQLQQAHADSQDGVTERQKTF